MNAQRAEAGLTLVEMMVVVALIGLVVSVSLPSITSGVDTVRLNAATDSVVSFFNSGLNRAERRQQVTEVIISLERNELEMRSVEPSFVRTVGMPEGVKIVKIYPVIPDLAEKARSIVLFPGGAVPRFGIELANKRGTRRLVRVDPMTGVPEVERPSDLQDQ